MLPSRWFQFQYSSRSSSCQTYSDSEASLNKRDGWLLLTEKHRPTPACRRGVTFLSHGLSVLAILLLVLGLYVNLLQHLNSLKDRLETWGGTRQNIVDSIVKRSLKDCPCTDIAAHGFLQSQGLEAIQMVGSLPALQIKKNGTIGPWNVENSVNVSWANLSLDGSQLVIQEPGLYFVYAQIFYLTSEIPNSFEIVRTSGSTREHLTVCSNHAVSHRQGSNIAAEVSCFTAVVSMLHRNQTLHLNQIEQNRVIIFSSGFSQWGLIRLQSLAL